MQKYRFLLTVLAAGLLFACDNAKHANAQAEQKQPAQQIAISSNENEQVKSALQANLDKADVSLKALSVTATDMPNIYLVNFDKAEAMFTDEKGEYLIQGQIAKISGGEPVDIGAKALSHSAAKLLAQVDKNEMIIFAPKGETKAAIYVFSDPTCHYCQKLHSEIDQLNAAGIEVRYLAWPRSDKWIELTESIWCSADRQKAMTAAKKGEDIAPAKCDNPVAKHMALGHQIGVSGTPAIFTESGMRIGGYLPAEQLAQQAITYK